jgi:hypothetical protein
MIEKKTWQEFRNTGLLFFINSILHAFGWSIVMELDASKCIKNVYPARVKFRGFEEKITSEEHLKIAKYLKENSQELYNEINE